MDYKTLAEITKTQIETLMKKEASFPNMGHKDEARGAMKLFIKMAYLTDGTAMMIDSDSSEMMKTIHGEQ